MHLLVIDPQNDFCDPDGSLYVPGADEDMARLADLVVRLADRLDSIHVTLDSHRALDISHPSWWRTAAGRTPDPFTSITASDVAAGRFTTADPAHAGRSLAYLRALERGGRYPHTIWPEHCIVGTPGHDVSPLLEPALRAWEGSTRRRNLVTKGENPFTEHFSAVRAEVPDPEDAATQTNASFVESIERADLILVAGEAQTHCVLNTVADLAASFRSPSATRKLVWLEDATSPVPDPPETTLFSDAVRETLAKLESRGMRIARTTDFAT